MFKKGFDRDLPAACQSAAGSLEPVRAQPGDIGTRSALDEIAAGLIGAVKNDWEKHRPAIPAQERLRQAAGSV